MLWIILAVYVAHWVFNVWALSKGWLADFGKVTRAEVFLFAMLAACPVAGFCCAVMSITSPAMKTSWSKFWNKPVLTK